MRHSLNQHRVNHKLFFYLIFLVFGWSFFTIEFISSNMTNDLSIQIPWWQYLHEHGFHGIATINSELYSQVGDQRHYAD